MAAEGFADFLARFCELHEREKRGVLSTEERAIYRKARDDLGELLVIGQRLELKPGENARGDVRVARAMPVEFEIDDQTASCLTRDLSVGGLCALIDRAPPNGTPLFFRLKLGRDVEPVVGRCRVVHASEHGGSTRMAVRFEGLSEEAADRVQTVVFDVVCASLRAGFLR